MSLEKLAYVVPHNLLAGSKFPSSEDSTLAEITAVRKFKTLISLTESPHPDAAKLETQYGLKQAIHLPISDFSTPSDAQIRRFVDILLEQDPSSSSFVNSPVLIHCHLGAGRTGLMLSIGIVAFYYFWKNSSIVDEDPEIGAFVKEIGREEDDDPKTSGKNLFTNVISYHRRVRPQSVMTTRQVRFLENLLLHVDEEKRKSLFLRRENNNINEENSKL